MPLAALHCQYLPDTSTITPHCLPLPYLPLTLPYLDVVLKLSMADEKGPSEIAARVDTLFGVEGELVASTSVGGIALPLR